MSTGASEIGIYQLKINIRTAIPKQEKLVLTSEMLNYTGSETLEKYPFFSSVHKYPRKKLQDLTYDKIIEFFFVYDIFRMKLKKRKVIGTKSKTATKGGKKKNYNTPTERLHLKQSNFVLMLQLLFPTVYPFPNNIDTSIGIITQQSDEVEEKQEAEAGKDKNGEEEEFDDEKEENDEKLIEKLSDKKNSEESLSFFDFKNIQSFFSLKGTSMFNFLPGRFLRKFSYLKIGGQDYTITRTIWLNDVMNHPLYNDIIKSYHMFQIWKETKQEIEENKEKWNIVLFALDTSIKTSNLFQKMHDEKNYYIRNKPSRYDEQFENMKDFDEVVDKINTEYGTFLQEIKPADKNIYRTRRNDLFTKFKNDQTLYDYLEKLTIYLKRIKSTRISSAFNTFLNNITTKISNFNKEKSYQEYVNNLNFEYLSNPDLSSVADKIREKYPEFNTFVNKIQAMKPRIIDNAVWSQVIKSIIKGSKYHNFQSKIWNKIDNCYGLTEDDAENDVSDDEEDEEEEEDDEAKEAEKKTNAQKGDTGNCSTSEKVLYVNFDEIKDKDPNKLADIKLIDLYLQMDVIEGKIDDSNMNAIKCDYTDTHLGHSWLQLTNGIHSWDLERQMLFFSAKKQIEKAAKKDK